MQRLASVHLNGLRAVEAAGRLGSLARAAEELGVTPGAVSQQIARTERQLGLSLFERTPRGLAPTMAGRPILDRLTAGFQELARAVTLAQARPADVLTVTVAPVFAAKWLVPRLVRFTAAHPGLRVRIDASVDLVDLGLGDVDVAIRVGRGDWPGLRSELLLRHHVFPVCSPALAEGLASPRDLGRVPAIRDGGVAVLVEWGDWLASCGLDEAVLSPGPVFSDASLCLDAAIAGQGIMLAWELLAADALADGRLVAPFPDRMESGRGYWLATAADRRPDARIRAFADWLRTEIATSVGS